MLKRGYDVVYVSEAVSWTETPATVRGFLRQQRRWKRGYVRESLFTLLYAWREKKLLWLQILLWDLTRAVPLVRPARRARRDRRQRTRRCSSRRSCRAGSCCCCPLHLRAAPRADKLPGLFLYMFFYECCLYWLNLWALFTVRNKSWVTRTPESVRPALGEAASATE